MKDSKEAMAGCLLRLPGWRAGWLLAGWLAGWPSGLVGLARFPRTQNDTGTWPLVQPEPRRLHKAEILQEQLLELLLLLSAARHMVLIIVLCCAVGLELAAACSSDLDCSLNGVCKRDTCVCDKPWRGSSCGVLGYKVTPKAGEDLFPINRSHNTWNGP